MKRIATLIVLVLLTAANVAAFTKYEPVSSTPRQASRDATREKLRTLLNTIGPKVNIDFRQSDKNLYNFVGMLKTGLKNADFLEVVISVTDQDTIGFRIYPHYGNSYVNIDKARNSVGLMRQLLRFSDSNFLYWGADQSGDVFAGYTFTLESGFPDEAIRVVLYSVPPLDQFIGKMRPMIDGTSGVN